MAEDTIVRIATNEFLFDLADTAIVGDKDDYLLTLVTDKIK